MDLLDVGIDATNGTSVLPPQFLACLHTRGASSKRREVRVATCKHACMATRDQINHLNCTVVQVAGNCELCLVSKSVGNEGEQTKGLLTHIYRLGIVAFQVDSHLAGGIVNSDNCTEANPITAASSLTRLGDVCVMPTSINWSEPPCRSPDACPTACLPGALVPVLAAHVPHLSCSPRYKRKGFRYPTEDLSVCKETVPAKHAFVRHQVYVVRQMTSSTG